jgi:hypothetical protein
VGWKQVSRISPEGDIRDQCLVFEEFVGWNQESAIESVLLELLVPYTNHNSSNDSKLGDCLVKVLWIEIRLYEFTVTVKKFTT